MPAAASPEDPVIHHAEDFYNRIYFLYQIIEDTQETVRFLDTKAGFCVTLLSGMAAVSIQHPGSKPALHIVLFALFMAVEVCSILVCLRVIFPTVKPHINNGAPAKPRFYIAHNKAHHWVKHTLANPNDNILSESKISYFESLKQATDEDLMSSLADTVLTLAFIRQIKSDRLHAAMFCLITSVFLFAAIMLFS
ncbi:hypothetical protein HDF16_002428 [Granulicella aggregans]|uniref:Pycsar effector protein domain-containing protein n=1 Tax=Granulicella aggregans TaxID=474949 RepID=A0A7W8E3M2_9BACT|nr:hypothetical protein [Granulicella aggregans]MBB5057722.1 hypothetical protein [Granulicella aggregans]